MYDADGNLMEPSGSSGGFFEAARNRVASFISSPQSQAVAGQLFEAVYQYGAGRIDAAREKAVGAFLMTSEGRKAQNEAIRQTVNQHLPMIVIGGGAVLILLLALFSRK